MCSPSHSAAFSAPPPLQPEQNCSICLEPITNSTMVKKQPAILNSCRHIHHISCIEAWLLKNRTCPICRQPATKATQVPFCEMRLPINWKIELINAAKIGNIALVNHLLDDGANINANLPENKTPLSVAIQNQQIATSELLVIKGGITSPQLFVNLGYKLLEGSQYPVNYEVAIQCLQKAAIVNHPHALYQLGIIYEQGLGVNTNMDEAKRYFERAANLDDPKAQCKLGDIYKNSTDEQSCYHSALWYKKAAEQNYSQGLFCYGQMLQYGHGVKLNLKLARSHYKKAAKQEHLEGLIALANMYQNGIGGKRRPFKERALRSKISALSKRIPKQTDCASNR